MKKLLILLLLSGLMLGSINTADARPRDRYVTKSKVVKSKSVRRVDRTRSIYVIERNRPVRRVVYVNDSGRYYHWSGGRRVYVTGRYYTSYPSRYYYRDGRPRIGVNIRF